MPGRASGVLVGCIGRDIWLEWLYGVSTGDLHISADVFGIA
jgi:hypothetical protein